MVRPPPATRIVEGSKVPSKDGVPGRRGTFQGPNGMPYSFAWLSIDPPSQSSVKGEPEWRRNEIRNVTMAIVVSVLFHLTGY